ncbi:ComEC family competence protein [Polystyrenella longa]|uniref:ComEC family competence protein n=1 Tax=Polystyrenella longa TaxID=2528007 RepID=A0A518CNL1_9PLAN|nr:DNA internalization-related competence protein ComEC/Rec2 [Polystyrenella longa]QDU80815.1 ComEC family competence protein [Polystyrenella longa]
MSSSTPPESSRLDTQSLYNQTVVILRRQPLILLLLPFAAGIATWEQIEAIVPITAVVLCWMVLLGSWFYSRRGSGHTLGFSCLLGICFLTGMLHLYAAYLPAGRQDIRELVEPERRLIRVHGKLLSTPIVKQKQVSERAPDWQRVPATTADLAIEHVYAGKTPVPFTGRLWITIRGEGLKADRGDHIETTGWLEQPFAASNPGEFDFRSYLKHQGIRGILRVQDAASVRPFSTNEDSTKESTSDWTSLIRHHWRQFAAKHLKPENQSLAGAMILGVRNNITPEQQEQFSQTGTMHFLAVSGLHVGILIFFLIGAGKLIRIPRNWLPYLVIITIWMYAFITDMNPPVMRASFLATFVFVGKLLARQATLLNLLSLAGLVLLVWQPTMMFDVGAQLSFLAVAAIIWGNESLPFRRTSTNLDHPNWRKHLGSIVSGLKKVTRLTLSIWLFTAPLVLLIFHFIAPIGLLINVILAPLVMVMLWTGYLMSVFLFLLPPLAVLLSYPFDAFLSLFQSLIGMAHEHGWGTWYAPSPPVWFLVLYYVSLLGFAAARQLHPQFARWRWIATGATIAVAFLLLFLPQLTKPLTITVLNVGHGSAILVEYPNGNRLLYDVGSIDGGKRAARAVQNLLWNQGEMGINCLLVSHADVDHFNGTHTLIATMPIATVCCSPQFLDFDQPAVDELIEKLDRADIPVQLIQAGDQLRIDEKVATKVLFPQARTRLHQDNDHSVVLLIEYAGRRILLTGDLEPEGQQELQHLLDGRLPVDLLTAPHHGAHEANGRSLFEQFSPGIVTVSSNSYLPETARELQRQIPDGEAVYFTRNQGAIRIEIDSKGELRVQTFLQESKN